MLIENDTFQREGQSAKSEVLLGHKLLPDNHIRLNSAHPGTLYRCTYTDIITILLSQLPYE